MYTIHMKSISSCRLEFRAGHRKLTPYMDMLIRILQRIFSPTKIPNDATEEEAAASSSLLVYLFAFKPFYCLSNISSGWLYILQW